MDIDVKSIEDSKAIALKNFRVYPNYDISQVTNYALYGSLQKRLSASITKIIHYFPACIEVNRLKLLDYSTANTASNISFNQTQNTTTTFKMDVTRFINHFDIDYSKNATRNIEVRPFLNESITKLNQKLSKICIVC